MTSVEYEEKVEVSTTQIVRLCKLASLFYEIDDSTKVDKQVLIFHMSISEDSELPELIVPDPTDKIDIQNRRENEIMRAKPTSIQAQEEYLVTKGVNEDEIVIIYHKRRVDLGYKIPKFNFGSTQEAADHLTNWFQRRKNMSEDERASESAKTILAQTLLTDGVTLFRFNPNFITQGELEITEKDLMTGLAAITEAKLTDSADNDSDINDFLIGLEFNLLNELQSRLQKGKVPSHLKEKGFAILENYLGRRLPIWETW